MDGGAHHLFMRYYRRALAIPCDVGDDAVASALAVPDVDAEQAHALHTDDDATAADSPAPAAASADKHQCLAALQAAYFNYRYACVNL